MNIAKAVILLLFSFVASSSYADFPMMPHPSWCRGNTPCEGLYDTVNGAPHGPYATPEEACLSFWPGRPWVLNFINAYPSPNNGSVPLSNYVDIYRCAWSTIYSTPDQRSGAARNWTCPVNAKITGDPYNYSYVNYRCQCKDGFQETALGGCTKKQEDPQKNYGPPKTNTCHPINIGTGVKYLSLPIYQDIANNHLNVSLHYNSPLIEISNLTWSGRFGLLWSSEFEQRIRVYEYRNNKPYRIGIRFSNGREWAYTDLPQANVFTADADVEDRVETVIDAQGSIQSWVHTSHDDGSVEVFDSTGLLKSIATKSGITKYLTYSDYQGLKYPSNAPSCRITLAANSINDKLRLNCVTDDYGNQINFTYGDKGLINTIINPQGGVINFNYNSGGILTSVTYPDLTVKTYHYGEVGHVAAIPAAGVVNANLLTGITDENAHRYADYYYDAQGRAFDENLAGGVEATNLVYNTDGAGNPTSTVATDSLGNVRTHNFTTVLGVIKSTGQSQPAGSGCAASASELTYDANGNVKARIDFNGNKTIYDYDMSRNLELSRTEGLTPADAATSATRTITTSWHPTWRLPLVISEYSGKAATGTPLKRITTAYDDKGNITTYTIEDPIRGLVRTTTTTYTYSTAVPGLILEKTVDGPLPTFEDRTRYYYYPHDATCAASNADPIVDPITGTSPPNLGCRGQLSQVIQSSGFMTVYNRYNHHGQVEEWTDSNQVIYTNSYDLRQRLIHSTVENEQTLYSYDAAGQLKKTTFPDGSELNYTYDQAHRLTEISNAMGDKVVYTLDDNGNRTNEEMFDSSGTLTKSITRSFDALNRAQTVTGE